MNMALKKSKQFEAILADFYQQFIYQEIASQRPFIEQLHILCSSFIMEKLLYYCEESQKKKEDEYQAREELNKFVQYLVNQKSGYLNDKIRDELLTLQKNRTDQYLMGYSQFYRYYTIQTTSTVLEKINYILQYLCQQNQMFQDFCKKVKINQESNQDHHNLHRNATISGLFAFHSKHASQNSNINQKDERWRDLSLIEDNMLGREKYLNTFLDDDWLKIITQIEKCQKSQLDTLTQQELCQIQELIEQKNLPFQIANCMKQEIVKKLQQKRQMQSNDDNDRSIKYTQYCKYKLQHDAKLAECLLNKQGGVIGAKLGDIANVVCYIAISKFCNVICCGCNDGNILVYDLCELSQKRTKLSCNASFEMHLHEGPITAISILYDENYMISVSADLSIRLSCLKSRQPLVVYKGHLQTVWHLTFAPMGYWFASASSDGTAMLWGTDQNQCIRIFGPVINQVKLVEFVPSVEYVITAEENRVFRIWSIDKAECLHLNYLDGNITCMNISFTGQYLCFGTDSGSVVLYYLPIIKLLKDKIYLQRIDYHSPNSRDYIRSVSISLDESTLICCNSNRLGFFSISDLMKKGSEDVYKGLETSLKQIEYDKNNWSRNAVPLELLELQDYIHLAQFVPNGYALYICK